MAYRRAFANVALGAASAYAAYTLWLIARMFWFISYSMTSAIRVDELVMMEELRLFHEGKYGISYLWAPYWGNRLLIPRLIMMADEHFFHFSNTPLVVISLTAQCLATGVLLWLEWRLLRSRPRWVTVFAMPATAHLALTSLQLETFLFGMQVPFTVGLLGGIRFDHSVRPCDSERADISASGDRGIRLRAGLRILHGNRRVCGSGYFTGGLGASSASPRAGHVGAH